LRRYYPLKDANIIGQYTVLAAGCAAGDKAVAVASNSPAAILSSSLAAATAAQTAQLAAMKARLDAVQPLLATLSAELPPSLTITGYSSGQRLWAGTPQQICYYLPPSGNVNPKNLVLYVGDGSSGTFYPTGLGAAGGPLPTDYQACVPFMTSPGVPIGSYSIALQDTTTGNAFTTVGLQTGVATVLFSAMMPGAAALTLTMTWNINAALASPQDTVKVINSQGNVIFWIYTSCNCNTAPGATAVPKGSSSVKIMKLNSVPGGYLVKLFPGGGNVVGAIGPNWVPWAKLGY